jgi:glycosyltransferase involved in cell wall biosynthesis
MLLYSGTFGEKDGIYYLIDAFSKTLEKHPDVLLIMTGSNSNRQIMEEVKEYIRNKGLTEYIILTGFISIEELSACYQMADILFVCRTNSLYANHGFPWKLGEYCLTGKPVIATRVSDIEVYFKENEDLFIVEPDNSDAIAGKIDHILNNYSNALSVAQRGKETAINSFGYLRRTREIADFIKYNNNTIAGIARKPEV